MKRHWNKCRACNVIWSPGEGGILCSFWVYCGKQQCKLVILISWREEGLTWSHDESAAPSAVWWFQLHNTTVYLMYVGAEAHWHKHVLWWTDPRHSWWRRRRCCEFPGGCHGYSQVTWSVALIHQSEKSCPPETHRAESGHEEGQ